jgi:serine protease Do
MGRVGTSAVLVSVFVVGGCATERIPVVAGWQAGSQAPAMKAKPIAQQKALPSAAIEEQAVLPTWTVVKPSKPPQQLNLPLAPSELFARVSPSVYIVRATREVKPTVLEGSAVAISAREAITNCHIVTYAKVITVSKGSVTLPAEVITAHPQSDRCYLRVQDGALEPIRGLRDYSDLAVGETVYTIGSPKGLDRTLAQGLLSGLRRMDNIEYIQITAPISEGSSGGGLFDDRGNLIGITTFTMKGSQNLNFAIAASEFWK